ncbi:MAG: hypothetical protein AVO35_04640 [Candidatus Aegiribacteria sp. MLS_C]|nr:MAG: hypothetical protein AVO35_04640 [Candidatus Aegiribacteria sp. MLS_C]
MVRGTLLLLALLSGGTPREALENTWAAVQEGSPRIFLGSLTPETSSSILDSCSVYLDLLRSYSRERLGEIFASLRIEAAPDEVLRWDSLAVLEMIMSSPGHHALVNDTDVLVDSVRTIDSMAVVHVTVVLPDGSREPVVFHTALSPLGWRTGGLEPLMGEILEAVLAE